MHLHSVTTVPFNWLAAQLECTSYHHVLPAIEAGANNYLLKDVEPYVLTTSRSGHLIVALRIKS